MFAMGGRGLSPRPRGFFPESRFVFWVLSAKFPAHRLNLPLDRSYNHRKEGEI